MHFPDVSYDSHVGRFNCSSVKGLQHQQTEAKARVTFWGGSSASVGKFAWWYKLFSVKHTISCSIFLELVVHVPANFDFFQAVFISVGNTI